VSDQPYESRSAWEQRYDSYQAQVRAEFGPTTMGGEDMLRRCLEVVTDTHSWLFFARALVRVHFNDMEAVFEVDRMRREAGI